ncbi:MAG TPA: cobyric acid synthase [Burkholderiales bacterium]|nr:cobyric acid synthase [Burkholderiales bacterium]
MAARAVMVLGATSGAGKSWLATALCRWYARQGLRVAPFKAQNMSNNARVVPALDGSPGEIGSAQYFQALAARARPDVRMNPVLLKPEHDTRSQVVVMGHVRADLAATPWRTRSEQLWPHAREALRSLLAENDLIVIEGAGSPAEINLHASDYVNMRTAREANAACLLVVDIDRGGAFAHLYGTHQLLPPDERALIRGFVLNRFRGDPSLLSPGPEDLERLTGVPTLAVIPMWREHGLPEEDGWFSETESEGRGQDDHGTASAGGEIRIAIVAFPRISNLDEFQPLRRCPGVRLRWARTPRDLDGADWIVLPGSKHTSGDLRWMRDAGLEAPIVRHAARGASVLGICGGLQMLGETMTDPDGVDGNERGLGLLPLDTTFARDKLLRQTRVRFTRLAGAWSPLTELAFDGYEIRHGRTTPRPGTVDGALRNEADEPIGWRRDNVLGVYAHGLFESPEVMARLFGAPQRSLDDVLDGLAAFIDRRFQPGVLLELARAGAPVEGGT